MLDFKIYTEPSDTVLNELLKVQKCIFEQAYNLDHLKNKIKNRGFFLSIHAYQSKAIIGFKTGYSIDKNLFYSWIGGVDPDYRKKGLAHKLMLTQHEILMQNGFSTVQTKTQNKFKEMLILNLKSGFEITDTTEHPEKGLQIVLEKKLIKNPI